MKKILDCRSFKKRSPLERVKSALEQSPLTHIEITTESEDAADAVSLYLHRHGFQTGIDTDGRIFLVEGKRDRPEPSSAPRPVCRTSPGPCSGLKR